MNIQKQIQSLIEAREQTWNKAKAVLDGAEGRDLTAAERSRYDALIEELDAAEASIVGLQERAQREDEIGKARRSYGAAILGDGVTRAEEGVALRSDESVTAHVERRGLVPADQRNLSIAKSLRGIALGECQDAEAEQRALSVGTGSAGGFIVPTILSAQLIDLARKNARVFQAGALTIPMDSSTLKYARQTSDPALTWHAENDAISDSAITFDQVTFTAKTLPCLIKMSLELLEDGVNAEDVVMTAMSKAIALELDRAALYGSGSSNQPTGVEFQSGITAANIATNGAELDYDTLSGLLTGLELQNFQANAAIMSPRTSGKLGRLKDDNNRYLAPPADVAALRILPSTQIVTNADCGTSTGVCSDVFVADWSQLLIGVRHALTIRVLDQTFAANGQVAFMAWLRADIQLAHPKAFSLLQGVL